MDSYADDDDLHQQRVRFSFFGRGKHLEGDYKGAISGKWTKLKIAMLGITGGLLTFIYDSLTTLSIPFTFGFENENLLAFYLAGIGFTFLHQLSNMAVFALVLPGLFSRIRQPSGTGS